MFYQVNKTTNQWIFHFILSHIHVPHISDDYIRYNKSMYLLVLSAPEKKDLHVLRHNNGFLFSRGLLDNPLCLQVAAHPTYFYKWAAHPIYLYKYVYRECCPFDLLLQVCCPYNVGLQVCCPSDVHLTEIVKASSLL